MATVLRNFVTKKGIQLEDGDLEIKNNKALKINDASNNSISISAPSSVTAYSLTLPPNDGNANDVLQSDGSGGLSFVSLGSLGGGTVTSVALSVPTGLAISGSPITSSGTLAITLASGYEIPTTNTLNSFVTLTGTETVTNKTLSNPIIVGPSIEGNVTVSSDSSQSIFDIANHDGSASGLALAGTLVTSTAAEINLLDGSSAGTVTNSKAVIYGSTGELAVGDGKLTINSTAVTSSAAELNILDGASLDVDELNILDGATLSTSELNILDGVTATTTELNILDGVTSSTAELNLLDGVTATTAELNFVDGVTSNIQSQLNSKLETETTTAIQSTSNRNIVFTDETSTDTTIDLQPIVRAQETTTSLSLNANTLRYTDEDGTNTDIDLSIYLDDTNLSRLTTGSVAADGIATFSREDGSAFTIDFSPIFGGYNISVAADDSTLREIGPSESIKFIGAGATTTASDAEGNITITTDISSKLDSADQFFTETNSATKTSGSLTLNDSIPINFGTGGSDSDIQHNGTDLLVDVNTGDLKIQLNQDFRINNAADTATAFYVDTDGATELKHNFVKKLETSSSGVTVTGSVTIDSAVIESTSTDTTTSFNQDFVGFGAEMLIMVEDTADTTKRQISKILVTHDGSDVYITEYGATWSDSELISGITGSVASNTVTVTVNTTANSDISIYTTSLA